MCPSNGDAGGVQDFLDACIFAVEDALAGGTLPADVTDNNTRLVWEKMSDDGSIHDQDDTYSLPDAIGIKIATLNAMNFAGHSDWRLPNVKEMMSILDYSGVYAGFASSCTGGCSVLSCNCIVYNAHWTSTNNAYHGFFGLQVNLFNGTVPTDYKTAPGRVRAVRGGA